MGGGAFGPWIDDITGLVESFRSAEPFPHVALDGFLTEDLAQGLYDEFPAIGAMPRSRDYIFGDKHELSSIDQAGAASETFATAVRGPVFTGALSTLVGRDVFIDPMFHGGGFHQGKDGSSLICT